MVLPAVVIVLAVALGAMQVAGEQSRLQSAASDAARSLGRGDTSGFEAVRLVSARASIVESQHDDLACVTVTAPANLSAFIRVTLSANACALDDGR